MKSCNWRNNKTRCGECAHYTLKNGLSYCLKHMTIVMELQEWLRERAAA